MLISINIISQGYMRYAEEYLNQVMNRVQPYLRGNGGPIIMVQVILIPFYDDHVC